MRGLQLLQASDHRGLQVQNLAGEWIDAPPIPGTFVVNFGKGRLSYVHYPRREPNWWHNSFGICHEWLGKSDITSSAVAEGRYAALLCAILPEYLPYHSANRRGP